MAITWGKFIRVLKQEKLAIKRDTYINITVLQLMDW